MWYRTAKIVPNVKSTIVYRGMSSAEYYSWINKGFIPKSKDVVSWELEGWAYDQANFGKQGIVVSFKAPPGTIRPITKGHWKTFVDIPITSENQIEVIYGQLESKEKIDSEFTELEAAKSECLKYMQPGIILKTAARNGVWLGVEILAKKGRTYTVKPLYTRPYNSTIDKLEIEFKKIKSDIKHAIDHLKWANYCEKNSQKLSDFGYSENIPTDDYFDKLNDEYDRIQSELELEIAKEKERTDNLVGNVPESYFPHNFQDGAYANEEDFVPFDKWFQFLVEREQRRR